MVLDAAKGIEPQTLKLFEVCRLRDIPIITFINKMDREALDPFELLDEIASKLALDPAPLYWPAGSGERFKGVLDLRRQQLPALRPAVGGGEASPTPVAFNSNAIVQFLDPDEQGEVEEGAMLVQEAAKPFDPASLPRGPHDAGLLRLGAAPLRRRRAAGGPGRLCAAAEGGRPRAAAAEETHVAPGDPEVTGFVFKVQANIDPNHRDRIAFLRLMLGRVHAAA